MGYCWRGVDWTRCWRYRRASTRLTSSATCASCRGATTSRRCTGLASARLSRCSGRRDRPTSSRWVWQVPLPVHPLGVRLPPVAARGWPRQGRQGVPIGATGRHPAGEFDEAPSCGWIKRNRAFSTESTRKMDHPLKAFKLHLILSRERDVAPCDKSVRSWCDGSSGSILHCADPLSYFSFQPVLHDWCNKCRVMCYPVCGMVHIKEPLLLIGKSSPCGSNGSPFSLSELSDAI